MSATQTQTVLCKTARPRGFCPGMKTIKWVKSVQVPIFPLLTIKCSIVTEATEKKVGQHHAKECQHLVQAENGVLYVCQHQPYTKCPGEETAVPRASRGKVTNKLKWLHDVTILTG